MRSQGPEEDPHEEEDREDVQRPETEHDSGSAEHSTHPNSERRRARGKKSSKGSFWRELPILIVSALVLTVLLQLFVARVFVIPSQSMEDTLHGCPGCTNDRILVDKISYHFSDPEPGDVVVFSGPNSWMKNEANIPEPANPVAGFFRTVGSLLGLASPGEKDFVKRVIATEGQTVECCDTQGRVTVNGKPLDESYIYWPEGIEHKQQPFGPVTVPENHLWVMGDNRTNSMDSRVQGGGGVAGAVPVENVIGKAQFIVLPPTRWQMIPEPNPQARALGAQQPAKPDDLPGAPGAALAALPMIWWARSSGSIASAGRQREHH